MMSFPRAARGPLLLLSLLALLAAAAARPAVSGAASAIPVRTCTGASTTVPAGFAPSGQWVVLENLAGQLAPHGGTKDFGGPPTCAVRWTGSGTSAAPQWIFCTQPGLHGCGEDPLGPASLQDGLDARARGEIAWALSTADLSTPVSRAVSQLGVWCVTDRVLNHRSNADIVAAARTDFAQSGVTLPAGAACPNWSAVDAGLRATPQLAVRADAAQVPATGVARFEITTNLPEVRVTPGFGLCPDAPPGLTLSGGVLDVTGTSDAVARTVPLCAAAPAVGASRELDASAPGTLAGGLTVIRSTVDSELCQLMVTASGGPLAAAAAVTGAPVAAPAPAAAVVAPPAPVVVTAQSTAAAHPTIAKRRVRRHGEPRDVRSGAAVRWAITLGNTGTATAGALRVCDVLGRGLAVLSTTPRATPSGGRVCWAPRAVRPGQHVTLRITTRVSVGADTRDRCHALANRAVIVGGPSATSKVTVCRRQRTRSGGTTG